MTTVQVSEVINYSNPKILLGGNISFKSINIKNPEFLQKRILNSREQLCVIFGL